VRFASGATVARALEHICEAEVIADETTEGQHVWDKELRGAASTFIKGIDDWQPQWMFQKHKAHGA